MAHCEHRAHSTAQHNSISMSAKPGPAWPSTPCLSLSAIPTLHHTRECTLSEQVTDRQVLIVERDTTTDCLNLLAAKHPSLLVDSVKTVIRFASTSACSVPLSSCLDRVVKKHEPHMLSVHPSFAWPTPGATGGLRHFFHPPSIPSLLLLPSPTP